MHRVGEPLGSLEQLAIDQRASQAGDRVGLVVDEGGAHSGIEPVGHVVAVVAALEHRHEVEPAEVLGPLLPGLDEARRVGQLTWGEDEEDRPTVDADVAGILERPTHVAKVRLVVGLARVGLLEQHLAVARWVAPAPLPAVVGPGEAEREIRLAADQHVVEGSLEQAPSPEPVVPVDEAGQSGSGSHLGLGGPGLWDAQVIEPEVSGEVGLVVATEEGSSARRARPLGEPRAPPLVVLRDRVVLRQVVGQDLHRAEATRGRRSPRALGARRRRPRPARRGVRRQVRRGRRARSRRGWPWPPR